MGTISTPSGSLGPEGKKTTVGWPAIVLVAVVAALLFTAARGYLKSKEKPPAPAVQPTAAVVHVLSPEGCGYVGGLTFEGYGLLGAFRF